MTIHFQCQCGQKMKAEKRKIGKTFPCPICGEPVTVPATDQRTPRDSDPLSDDDLASAYLSDTDLVAAPAASHRADAPAEHEPEAARDHPTPPRERELPATSSTTANAARDLFLRMGAKDREEALSGREAVRSQKEKKPGLDFGTLFREGGRTLLPGAVLTVLGCLLAYWLASSMMGTDRGWPELGQVSGVVRLDGQPLPGATVTFRPVTDDDKNASKISSSVGMTDAEGRYTLMYVQDAPGAAVGAHQVLIEASLPNGAQLLPPRYNIDTQLSAEVNAGSNPHDFDLTSDKAQKK